MKIQLAGADQKPLLRTLLAEYLAELSQYGEVDADYPYFDAYWTPGEQRWPYLVLEGSDVAGFAMVNTWSPSGRGTDFSMAEFTVLQNWRGNGLGVRAAKAVFGQHPGRWELSVMARNVPALTFWPRAIDLAEATESERIEGDTEVIHRFVIAGGIWPM